MIAAIPLSGRNNVLPHWLAGPFRGRLLVCLGGNSTQTRACESD